MTSEKFLEKFPQTKTDQPLAPLNSMRIGGTAELYYRLTNTDELPMLVQEAKKQQIPFFILGGGSNTIFADDGFRGLVIHFQARQIALANQSKTGLYQQEIIVSAEAGALLSQLVQFAQRQHLGGLERLMGIPGTIGGAVRGNAGAFGSEIKDFFVKALLYDPQMTTDDGVFEAGPEYFDFGYRYSSLKKNQAIILKVFLQLRKIDPGAELAELLELTADIVKNRLTKQPKGYCSGSFFKNPGSLMGKPDDPKLKAGYLLEQAGCKGLQIGQIKVSENHANWIVNLGSGSQKEVIELAKELRKRVFKQFKIELQSEVQLVGSTGLVSI